jgi:DNA excision repair protein ERCC-2
MSGTLSPTSMYKELLGFDTTAEESYKSPFPEKNKLNIIIPRTSTKYETRNEEQYREIAEIIVRATNKIPGNTAVFFPSYILRDDVNKHFSKLSEKPVFVEKQKFTKKEKLEFLEAFKGYKNVGAVLLGVIGGNFGEGIDLPGDFLKGVIIVGLPLQRPDLETQALIKYYDEKFKKGWDYGYLFPAFNRALQSAGRCIRSETDKGVIIFLDERYTWKNYNRCFPPSWDMKATLLYEKMIEDFFENNT